jgi:polyhydroxyalkanoate synthesis repressor PhaR
LLRLREENSLISKYYQGKIVPIIIKRYTNRKLYNPNSKKYITLEGIGELIKQGEEIKVIDYFTGADLTAVTISQILFELEKNQSGNIPLKILMGLVQSAGTTLEAIRRNIFLSFDALHYFNEEIERRVSMLVELGDLTEKEGSETIRKLINVGGRLHEILPDIERKNQDFYKEQKIPTKRDLQILIQQIEKLTQRVDEISKGS